MAAGAWDRTAAVCYAVAASMGAKNVSPEMFNPLRKNVRRMGTMDDLIGGVEEVVKLGPKKK
jgi:hypothetical protein